MRSKIISFNRFGEKSHVTKAWPSIVGAKLHIKGILYASHLNPNQRAMCKVITRLAFKVMHLNTPKLLQLQVQR